MAAAAERRKHAQKPADLDPEARFVAFSVDDFGAVGEEGQALLRELTKEAALPGGAGEPGFDYDQTLSRLLQRWREDVSASVWVGVTRAIVERGARARKGDAAEAASCVPRLRALG